MSDSDKNPILDELESMKQRMEALFSESFADDEAAPEDAKGDESIEERVDLLVWEPHVDIWETEEEWWLVADLPGVLDEDLRVEVSHNQLTVAGRRSVVPPAANCRVSQVERSEGSFSRTFVLPQCIRRDAISAELKRGVLTVVIPKDDVQQPVAHKVTVRSD